MVLERRRTGLVPGLIVLALAVACAAGTPAPPAPAVPGAPTDVNVTAGPEQVTVTWAAPADDGRSPLTGFVIAWSQGSAGTLSVDDGAATSAVITGLTDATSYTFTVAAQNAVGTGPASAPSDPAVPATLPDAPVLTGVTPGIRTVHLTWSAPDDHGSQITNYVVTQSLAGGAFATAIVTGLSLSSVDVVGLQNGGTYSFEVTAINGVGSGPASAPSDPVTLVDLPGATGLPGGVGRVRSATLSWTAPASDGGSPITGYAVIQRKYTELDFVPSTLVQVHPTDTTATVTGLDDGDHFTFKVRALTLVGAGPLSAATPDVATPAPPLAPTIISAVPFDDGVITLSWVPSYDGGSPITGYTVVASDSKRTVVAGAGTSVNLGGLDQATAYSFSVLATNAAGDSPLSAASDPVKPHIPLQLPGKPARPTALSGIRGALVHITPGSAGGGTIDRYVVGVDDGSGLTSAQVDSLDLSVVPATAHVSGLSNGVTYRFAVSAHNEAGTGAPSDLSDPVTTAKLPAQPAFGRPVLGDGSVTLTWNDATQEAAHPVALYTLTQVYPAGTARRVTSARALTVSGLVDGTAYVFSVHATNDVGDGPESVQSAPFTPCPGDADPDTGVCSTTIYAVKTRAGSGDSQLLGRLVSLTGVRVTGLARDGSGFFVQTAPDDAAWSGADRSGVFCALSPAGVSQGDAVDVVAAEVAQSGGEIQLRSPSSAPAQVTIASHGNPLAAPEQVTTSDVATGGARVQALDGVPVQLAHAAVSAVLAGGDFVVDSALRAGSRLYLQNPSPIEQDELDSLAGILSSASGSSTLEPRGPEDLAWGSGPLESFGGGGPYFIRVGPDPAATFPIALAAAISIPRSFDLPVTVTSSNAALLVGGSAQTQVVIPAGQRSVIVPVTGVSRRTAVSVSATTGTGLPLAQDVRVLDGTDTPALAAIAAPQSLLLPGRSVTLTLSLTVPPTVDTQIGLSFTNAANLAPPLSDSVTIAAGQISAQVNVQAAATPVAGVSTVTASLAGQSVSADLHFAFGENAGLLALLDQDKFEQLFPNRNALYTWNSLLAAAKLFPRFLAEGTSDDQARELAAFFANASHETTGGWPAAPGGPYAWGLYFTEEVGCGPGVCTAYCDWSNTTFPCVAGKTYDGRGPIQLSYNYNYGLAGLALGLDLLSHPELVATDSTVSWETALWFWMTAQSPKPSAHDVMAGVWTPSAADTTAGRAAGFGLTVDIINGGVECGLANQPQVADRLGFYSRYTSFFQVDPGPNLDCQNMRPY